jgi:hypothetical protein
VLWSVIGLGASASAGQSAASVADRFLTGIQCSDPVERARLLEGVRWNAPGFEYPVFENASTVLENVFGTDVAGVKGYERLVQLHVALRPGVHVLKTYRLIAYADRRWGRWKVWAFHGSHDVEGALAHWREQLQPGAEPDPASILEYGYYLSISGRLREALEMYEQAAELVRTDPAGSQTQSQLQATIRDLRRIVSRW